MPLPRALTIAGSDSGGGAGIQADLKTFAVLGVYGCSVLTALTAQNTLGVHGIHEIPPDFVRRQIDAVLDDIGADAVKTGMLFDAATVRVVSHALHEHEVVNLVVDPVMVAKSGDRLLQEQAVDAVRDHLLPLAAVITPNAEEAAILTGAAKVRGAKSAREAAVTLVALGARAVLIKGGHLDEEHCNDYWYDGRNFEVLSGERLDARHTHGTGCTLSAALAAFLARGAEPLEAARRAKEYLSGAIAAAEPLGKGVGPVNHLWQLS